MKYEHILRGTFLERPNRFLARVAADGKEIICHVKNTGRCRELLLPGAQVFLQHHPDAAALGRKTEYSLIGVKKATSRGELLINMDSQAPNQAAFEWLSAAPSISDLRREVTFQSSRFDLAYTRNGRPAFMEVKGVTLEENGIARFPDAPTERGIKHLLELKHAAQEGYAASVLFVIQMKGIHEFQPNMAAHPAFGEALRDVSESGVHVMAYDCLITEDSMTLDRPVTVNLLSHDR
ncbi:DNA/RNA nuclease SfsA [Clostridium sp. MCC353]|uniref:DNA/RNA nuclease SfsA n=1 Tax=Clostridium sp. MCC353 TaxID=2592646 RepID=UPI001C037CEC|nr:DNA/RNA nuclease SfsA [Clostridium sp. MCC353]MBT9777035.1 DNA/RNA nuclease SfsA [Clostridium sp. MCC353]